MGRKKPLKHSMSMQYHYIKNYYKAGERMPDLLEILFFSKASKRTVNNLFYWFNISLPIIISQELCTLSSCINLRIFPVMN